MPDESSKKAARRRIDCVAKVMRQFGLSDPGDLADELAEPPFPSLPALERKVKALGLRLPPNVSPRFVAEALLAAINEAPPKTIKWREAYGKQPALDKIKTGAQAASTYHHAIFDVLRGIFSGALSNGKIEQEINHGVHRVDIMFDNFADRGFFADVTTRLNLPSSYVPAECKNYSDDLASPEYDQLSGRMNDHIGRVGLLVFRKISDQEKALKHVQAKWEKRELIVMLDDEDIMRMHKAMYDGRTEDVDAVLWEKVRAIKLKSAK